MNNNGKHDALDYDVTKSEYSIDYLIVMIILLFWIDIKYNFWLINAQQKMQCYWPMIATTLRISDNVPYV